MGKLAEATNGPHRREIRERIRSPPNWTLEGLVWSSPPQSKPI
jgi:hypothetical protein